MRIRRLAVAAVAVAALAGFTGCASGSKSPATDAGKSPAAAPASSAPADAGAELAAAGDKFAGTSVRLDVTATSGIKITGAVDADRQKIQSTTNSPLGTLTHRQVGNDLYVQAKGQIGSSIGATPGKWMHIDLAEVPASSALHPVNNDPSKAMRMLTTNSGVTKTGEHTFAGKLDLTQSSFVNPAALKSLGVNATAVPFTAETDAEGRLVELVLDLEAIGAGAGKMTAKYSDYGVPVTVTAPPAAQVVEMPAKARKAMGA